MAFRRVAALAFGLSLIGAASQAQMMGPGPGTQGPYVRGEGGWNHINGINTHGGGLASLSTNEGEGYILGGALGYGFGQFRVELNLDYRNNDVNSAHFPGLVGGAGGSVSSVTGMVNGLMDLPVNWMGIQPYIGAGVGAARVELEKVSIGATQLVNDSDMMPAVQGIAGLRYDLTPNWGVGLEYRFLNGFHPSFRAAGGAGINTNDYRSHSVLVSFTYKWGAPPPPPPMVTPAAAPAPMAAPPPPPAAKAEPRNVFIVFFDFDRSTITDAGKKVLDEAASAFGKDRPIRIELTGYTDTMGTQQYNMGLSKRRADAVAAYLSGKGVPKTAMNVAWKGKTDLRVPTPDQVREPQNRRVEIVLP